MYVLLKNIRMMNLETFQTLVRENLKGWYSRKEHEDKAGDRITAI